MHLFIEADLSDNIESCYRWLYDYCVITDTSRRDHIMSVLREHHWLAIRECVKFKVACLVHQSLSGQAPLLCDDCCILSDSTRHSRRTLSSYGDKTSAAAGPRLWNSLPVQLWNQDITYGLFRRQLKGHLFQWHGALWLLICGALEKHLLTNLWVITCRHEPVIKNVL